MSEANQHTSVVRSDEPHLGSGSLLDQNTDIQGDKGIIRRVAKDAVVTVGQPSLGCHNQTINYMERSLEPLPHAISYPVHLVHRVHFVHLPLTKIVVKREEFRS